MDFISDEMIRKYSEINPELIFLMELRRNFSS